MTNLTAYFAAWTMAHFFETAALVIVTIDPVAALRLASMAVEVRGMRI